MSTGRSKRKAKKSNRRRGLEYGMKRVDKSGVREDMELRKM